MKQFHFQTKINVYYANFDIPSVSAFVQALLNSHREKILIVRKFSNKRRSENASETNVRT